MGRNEKINIYTKDRKIFYEGVAVTRHALNYCINYFEEMEGGV
jgi:hypothetical protein